MNLAAIMQLKEDVIQFGTRHPKLPLFFKAVHQNALQEGSVIEIQVTAPDGTALSSNVKLTAEDLELFNKLRSFN